MDRQGYQLFRVMDAPHRGQFPEYAAQVVPQREHVLLQTACPACWAALTSGFRHTLVVSTSGETQVACCGNKGSEKNSFYGTP